MPSALHRERGNAEGRNVRIEYQDALMLPKLRKQKKQQRYLKQQNRIISSKLDIIVSNPPHICEKEKADMEKNVLEHEPSIALFVPDEDPLKFYRAIAEYALCSQTRRSILLRNQSYLREGNKGNAAKDSASRN